MSHENALQNAKGRRKSVVMGEPPSVANHWQRDADDGHETDIHADVDEHLEHDHGHDSAGQQAAKRISGHEQYARCAAAAPRTPQTGLEHLRIRPARR